MRADRRTGGHEDRRSRRTGRCRPHARNNRNCTDDWNNGTVGFQYLTTVINSLDADVQIQYYIPKNFLSMNLQIKVHPFSMTRTF